MMKGSTLIPVIAAIAGVLFPSAVVHAGLVDFYFTMGPNADEVVGSEVESDGVGAGWLRLDTVTNTIDWSIVFNQLTGVPTMASFHGPAEPGENADVQIVLDHTMNPMIGSAVIDDVQKSQLLDNLWYVSIATEAYPAGEIRGQIVRVIPEPATVVLLVCGGLLVLRKRRRRV
jgi:hypothetical protein